MATASVPGEGQRLADYFGTESLRTSERTVSGWLPVRPGLRDAAGALRAGPVAYAVDMATGLAMGLAVLDDDRWVVTTDMDVSLVTPVVEGPLRVDAEVLRAGATTVVSAFSLHDEGAGRAVGGGTCTGRPFPFDFDRASLDVPIGARHGYGRRLAESDDAVPMATVLGLRSVEGGVVEAEIGDWLRNPWGILHGGVTSCLVDASAEAAGGVALGHAGRVAATTIRFLAPGRVGPVRAIPRVVAVGEQGALVEVRITDEGAGGRILVAASAVVA